MASLPPFVKYRRFITTRIGSTPTLVCGVQNWFFIDSLFVCNTGGSDALISFKIKIEEDLVEKDAEWRKSFNLLKDESRELVTESLAYLGPGDTMFANTNFSGDFFNCFIFGRLLTDPEAEE